MTDAEKRQWAREHPEKFCAALEANGDDRWGLNWALVYHLEEFVDWMADGYGQSPTKNRAALRAIDLAMEAADAERT